MFAHRSKLRIRPLAGNSHMRVARAHWNPDSHDEHLLGTQTENWINGDPIDMASLAGKAAQPWEKTNLGTSQHPSSPVGLCPPKGPGSFPTPFPQGPPEPQNQVLRAGRELMRHIERLLCARHRVNDSNDGHDHKHFLSHPECVCVCQGAG